MTSIILITGLIIALSASLLRNWHQSRAYEQLKSRYTQLYEQTDTLATENSPVERWYDPDDYTDLTSHQVKQIGERS